MHNETKHYVNVNILYKKELQPVDSKYMNIQKRQLKIVHQGYVNKAIQIFFTSQM